MKQIIPLKKDIIFKTKIGEITNINIDKKYKIKDDLIDGMINVYGSYKMTEASVLEEEFNYKIPFGVSISKNIKKETINIEIEDFNYKFDKDILSVDIDLNLECDEYIEEEEKELDNNVDIDVDNSIEEDNMNIETNINEETNNQNNINIEENINNITNIINNEEKYYTYKVYIVREGDTIESICNKYNVTLNDLEEYNDINNLKVNDKIIIPYIDE